MSKFQNKMTINPINNISKMNFFAELRFKFFYCEEVKILKSGQSWTFSILGRLNWSTEPHSDALLAKPPTTLRQMSWWKETPTAWTILSKFNIYIHRLERVIASKTKRSWLDPKTSRFFNWGVFLIGGSQKHKFFNWQ